MRGLCIFKLFEVTGAEELWLPRAQNEYIHKQKLRYIIMSTRVNQL